MNCIIFLQTPHLPDLGRLHKIQYVNVDYPLLEMEFPTDHKIVDTILLQLIVSLPTGVIHEIQFQTVVHFRHLGRNCERKQAVNRVSVLRCRKEIPCKVLQQVECF